MKKSLIISGTTAAIVLIFSALAWSAGIPSPAAPSSVITKSADNRHTQQAKGSGEESGANQALQQEDAQTKVDFNTYFYKGNALYAEGDFHNAAEAYTRLLETGEESGNLYFNLGNAYFRQGELGRAILNYQRAMTLIPRDSDLRANLAYALSQSHASDKQQAPTLRIKAYTKASGLTADEWTGFAFFCVACIAATLIAAQFSIEARKKARTIVPALALIALLASCMTYLRVSLDRSKAIMLAPESQALFEPRSGAKVHFELTEGMTVFVSEQKDGWSKIIRPDAQAGWIPAKNAEKVLRHLSSK